jgi:hypothetical protein
MTPNWKTLDGRPQEESGSESIFSIGVEERQDVLSS